MEKHGKALVFKAFFMSEFFLKKVEKYA